ncbi:type VI secretion system lipoprotein TssJ [Enterobacteriaceae bacterium 4M9]|nr:type VI secretion system lipoprotein TssJ [Enterobacteriaceae bacterium 4M9]
MVTFEGKWRYTLIFITLLFGCSKPSVNNIPEVQLPQGEQQAQAYYNLTLRATREANINAAGQPVPLKINIFKLRSDTAFMNADYFSLHDNPKAVLGNNLIDSEPLFLLPDSETLKLSGKKTDERYYIGVTGEFQNLKNKVWRIAVAIDNPEKAPFYKFWVDDQPPQEITLIADGQGLRIDPRRDEKAKPE